MVFSVKRNGGEEMKTKMKVVALVALIVGMASLALFAVPIQAYVNGVGNGDCDGDMLQERDQVRERLRLQDCNCTGSYEQYRYRYRERCQVP